MERPAVDVVVPFAGSDAALAALAARLPAALALAAGDTLTIVDNRSSARDGHPVPGVVAAPAQRSSYHARNRGAERGSNSWLVFLDADVEPLPGLIEAYFEPPPGDRTAVLSGGVRDETPPAAGLALAQRYQHLSESMSQEQTLADERWAFAKTANCAVLRAAFHDSGGFGEGIRSGGDADLCFRLREAGWALERREDAAVVHRNRTTMRALLRQRVRHGAGMAWLAKRHPGAFPRRSWPGSPCGAPARASAASRRFRAATATAPRWGSATRSASGRSSSAACCPTARAAGASEARRSEVSGAARRRDRHSTPHRCSISISARLRRSPSAWSCAPR